MEIILLFVVILVLAETTYLTIKKYRQRTLKVARGSLLLDTSAIMDGRIVDVAKTGVITAELIVPRSVINELQLLADKADHEKRTRARNGLENIRKLQKMTTVAVTIVNDGHVGSGGVDERLLELAKNYDASIATTDFNLNKVAKVVGITVVNVNELAQILRAQYLPGEITEIQLIQPGANRDQAVGYLDDGTMVVVEDARNSIGQKVQVEVVRSLQTEAGRMMFAKKKTSPKNNKIKTAPSFHSDQVQSTNRQKTIARRNKSNQTAKSKSESSDKKSQTNSKSNNSNKPKQSAEDAMINLANRKN